MENNIPYNHPHHTKLYIVLGVVVVFAIVFFILRARNNAQYTAPPNSVTHTSLPDDRPLVLSPEEQKAQEELLANPSLTRKSSLSTKQKLAQEKLMSDPALTRSSSEI